MSASNNMLRYEFCDYCYVEAPTRRITFHQVIGAVFIFIHRRLQGNLCKSCINNHFWEFTLTSMFLGLFSPPSLIWMIYCVPANIIRYIRARDLKPVPKEAVILDLSDDIIKKLIPFKDEIFQRLENQEDSWLVAKKIADKVGIRLGHVIIYLRISAKLAPYELGLLSECPSCGSRNVQNSLVTVNRSKDDRLNDGYWEKWVCKCDECSTIWNAVSTAKKESKDQIQYVGGP